MREISHILGCGIYIVRCTRGKRERILHIMMKKIYIQKRRMLQREMQRTKSLLVVDHTAWEMSRANITQYSSGEYLKWIVVNFY
jgi:hypothetical protein